MASVATLRARLESSLPESLSSTLLLRERVTPLTVPTGVAALDALTGGLLRGALSEIIGPASSGRTGVMLAALAEATRRQEVCALMDASDSFDPVTAAAAGVDLERLLWVRCNDRSQRKFGARTMPGHSEGRFPMREIFARDGMEEERFTANFSFAFSGVLEQVLKGTDLLLQSGGFGMVTLDLGDIPPESARRIPLTSWFRFRRAVEPTATVLLLVGQEPCASTCASLVVRLERKSLCAFDSVPFLAHQDLRVAAVSEPGVPENNVVSHATLLRGIRSHAEVIRSSNPSSDCGFGLTQHKPAQPADFNLELQTTW